MNKAMKAALLSGFVFPGLGHLMLKKQLHGIVLILLSTLSLYLVFSSLFEVVTHISQQLQSGLISLELDQIAAEISQQNLGTPSLIFTLCWFIGIIDSYRIGRVQDKLNIKDH